MHISFHPEHEKNEVSRFDLRRLNCSGVAHVNRRWRRRVPLAAVADETISGKSLAVTEGERPQLRSRWTIESKNLENSKFHRSAISEFLPPGQNALQFDQPSSANPVPQTDCGT
jgi:hypothetical protein